MLTPVGLLCRRTRAVALALAIQVVMMCRNGYMPYAYVIAMLPFGALVIAGVADQLCKGYTKSQHLAHPRRFKRLHRFLPSLARRAGQLVVVVAVIASVVVIAPAWARDLHQEMTEDRSQPPKQALAYVVAHVPHNALMLVDDNLWTDLVRRGFRPPIWFYKLDLDPGVRSKLKHGWRDVDYVLLGPLAPNTLHDLPLVAATIQNSTVVASFGNGELTLRKVNKNVPGKPSTRNRHQPMPRQQNP